MPTATKSGGGRKKTAAASKTAEIRVLSLEQIEQATHLREKIVPIPEWGEGVGVKLRQLTKQQHVDVKKLATVRATIDEDQVTYHAIVESMIDPVLTHDQIGVIAAWPSSVVDRIEAEMLELNGMTTEALEALEAAFRAITG